FSSRRRHTRWPRDWSSDVCSSDLVSMIAAMILAIVIGLQPVFHDLPALFLCVVGGVTAALTVRVLRRRSNFYVPVLIIALGYLAGAVALGLAGSGAVAGTGLRGGRGSAN